MQSDMPSGIALLKELDQFSQANTFASESVQHVYNNMYTLWL